ncbi:MAG: hypothetical protein KAI64_00125, partial [Thermoplasmata archaeon]|nr:hypothetical protein [Thermoplasmata archaeon]
EVYKAWNALSGKFGETMTEFLKEYGENYDNVYGIWTDETRGINKRLTNIMKDFGTDYETLYKMYFNRTGAFQTNWTKFPYKSTKNLSDEITDLKNKIEKLERKLDRKGH